MCDNRNFFRKFRFFAKKMPVWEGTFSIARVECRTVQYKDRCLVGKRRRKTKYDTILATRETARVSFRLERFGHCPGGENSSSKFDPSYSLHSKERLIHSLFGLAFY